MAEFRPNAEKNTDLHRNRRPEAVWLVHVPHWTNGAFSAQMLLKYNNFKRHDATTPRRHELNKRQEVC
jgi:hypothetical protein